MLRRIALAFVAVLIGFGATGGQPNLELRNETLELRIDDNVWTLAPDTPEYHLVMEWVRQNQSGWVYWMAERVPYCRVAVRAGHFSLAFGDSTVFAYVDEGIFRKTVPADTFSFLTRPRAPTKSRSEL